MRDAAINLIKALSGQYGVDSNFALKVAKYESDFNPNATSPKGAMGIMQLMPGTAAGLGVKDPYNMEQNIHGGLKYLSQLQKQFPGRPDLVAAAYNAGPGAVSKYGGQVPPYKETQQFVRNIMGDNTPIFSKPEANMANSPRLNAGVLPEDTMNFPQLDISQSLNMLQEIARQAGGQQRAPIPTGAVMPQSEVLPATSERGMELARVLGALAGVAGPTYAKAGGAISEMAASELEQAHANRAAQTMGYPTWRALQADKIASEAGYSRAATGAAGAKALEEVGKVVGGLAELPTKIAVPTMIGDVPVHMTGSQLAEMYLKNQGLDIQRGHLGVQQGQLGVHAAEAGARMAKLAEETKNLRIRVPFTNPDGTPMLDQNKQPVFGDLGDWIRHESVTNPAKFNENAILLSNYTTLAKELQGFGAAWQKAQMPGSKETFKLDPFFESRARSLGDLMFSSQHPTLKTLGAQLLVDLNKMSQKKANPLQKQSPLMPKATPGLPGTSILPPLEQ